ncbi:MAG: lipid-A-disaccharide synthase N-terminal domain-containing protein [Verrucomicrobiota bacterium]
MTQPQRKLLLVVFLVLAVPWVVWMILYYAGAVSAPGEHETTFKRSDPLASLEIVETDDGPGVKLKSGEVLSSEEFLETLDQLNSDRGWFFKLLNITSWTGVFWVGFGLLAQVVFTGRMIVQWWASEKEKRSVVPVAFWWMSLAGASMLIVYFIWRKDIVGVLGQSTGWFIYVRNLWFIHSGKE